MGILCNYGVCQSASPEEISPEAWVLDLEDIEKDTGRLLQKVQKKQRPTTSNKHIFNTGNVLYSKLRTYLNKVLIADSDGYCTSEILPLDFGKYVIAPYARHVLMSKMFLDYTAQCGYGVKMPRLGTNDGKMAFFPLPPLAEQQCIVEQIETLLKYVDIIDADAETLEKSVALAKQKILDLAIRGKLVPQDPADEPASELLKKIKAEKDALVKAGKLKKDKHESYIFKSDDNCYYEQLNGKNVDITAEIPFELPESWCWCRLRSLGQIVGGGTPSTTNQMFWNGSIPWLSPADLTGYPEMYIERGKKNITEEGLERSSAVLMPAGSILYSSRAPIGYVVISKNPISTNQGFKSLVPAIAGMSEFYYFVLKARTPDIKQRATGTTFKEISGNDFGNTLVPLPPITEQKRIVQAIAQYNSILELISK